MDYAEALGLGIGVVPIVHTNQTLFQTLDANLGIVDDLMAFHLGGVGVALDAHLHPSFLLLPHLGKGSSHMGVAKLHDLIPHLGD